MAMLRILLALGALTGLAPAGDFSLASPGDFLRSASQAPVPAADGAAPVAFLMTELRLAPFKGRDPLETRANAERFVAGLGLRMKGYQDNEAVRAMDVVPEPAGRTLMGRAQRYLLLRDARAALAGSALVKEVSENGAGFLTALFARTLYEEEAASVKARLPAGLRASVPRNAALKGLWVQLEAPAGQDPKGAAAALAAAHPGEIAACSATADAAVFRAATRAH